MKVHSQKFPSAPLELSPPVARMIAPCLRLQHNTASSRSSHMHARRGRQAGEGHQAGIRHQASGIRHQASGVRHQALHDIIGCSAHIGW